MHSTAEIEPGPQLPAELPRKLTRPLEVEFEANAKCWRFYCSASELQTFERFQQVVLERCGVWLPREEILSAKPRDAKQEWSDAIAFAVNAGEGSNR